MSSIQEIEISEKQSVALWNNKFCCLILERKQFSENQIAQKVILTREEDRAICKVVCSQLHESDNEKVFVIFEFIGPAD